jgi:hypothetical protein
MQARAEHLKWCKDRALEYVDRGDIANAFTSFTSDMNKHPQTANNVALEMGAMLMFSGNLSTERQMREWINGFN